MTVNRKAEITTEIASFERAIMMEQYKDRGYDFESVKYWIAQVRELKADLADLESRRIAA